MDLSTLRSALANVLNDFAAIINPDSIPPSGVANIVRAASEMHQQSEDQIVEDMMKYSDSNCTLTLNEAKRFSDKNANDIRNEFKAADEALQAHCDKNLQSANQLLAQELIKAKQQIDQDIEASKWKLIVFNGFATEEELENPRKLINGVRWASERKTFVMINGGEVLTDWDGADDYGNIILKVGDTPEKLGRRPNRNTICCLSTDWSFWSLVIGEHSAVSSFESCDKSLRDYMDGELTTSLHNWVIEQVYPRIEEAKWQPPCFIREATEEELGDPKKMINGIYWASERNAFVNVSGDTVLTSWEGCEKYGKGVFVPFLGGRRPERTTICIRTSDMSLWSLVISDTGAVTSFQSFDLTLQQQINTKQQMLTSSSDIWVAGSELLLTDLAKRAVFEDMIKAACGDYLTIDHNHTEAGKPAPYCLNELWLTYEEMQAVYAEGPIVSPDSTYYCRGARIKTNILNKDVWGAVSSLNYAFGNSGIFLKIRVARNNEAISPSNFNYFCMNSPNITDVLGILDFKNLKSRPDGFLLNAKSLKNIKIKNNKFDFPINWCASLSCESIRYLIENRMDTNVFTITLHKDIYAKIISDEGEWAGLLDLAQSKNISIASA